MFIFVRPRLVRKDLDRSSMSQTEDREILKDNVTVLSRNTEIRGGSLRVAHDLTVRGVIEGEVSVGGKVVVVAGARVIGTLSAREAVIAGTVSGELVVADTLTLRGTSVVDGKASASRLVVEDGSSGVVDLRVGDKQFLDLLEARRDKSRAERDRVLARHRSRVGAAGSRTNFSNHEGRSSARGQDREGAGLTSEDLMESREMSDFLGDAGEMRPASRPAEGSRRGSD